MPPPPPLFKRSLHSLATPTEVKLDDTSSEQTSFTSRKLEEREASSVLLRESEVGMGTRGAAVGVAGESS